MWRIDSQGLANEERAFQMKHVNSLLFNLQVHPPPQSLISGGPKAHKHTRTQPGRE